jgi:acyl-CoA thioester hydrolase
MGNPKTFSAPIEVRFADLDAYGHVNNATYFTYLEVARTKLFLERFLHFMHRGLLFLVVRAECEYRKPIEFPAPVIVTLTVDRLGNSSFDLDYLLHDDAGTTYATARTVMVCFDRTLGRAVSLPEEFKTLLT